MRAERSEWGGLQGDPKKHPHVAATSRLPGWKECEEACGCDGLVSSPLDGVVLLTAANSTEVSFAVVYDSTVDAWLADQFSVITARLVESSPLASVSDLYEAAYVGVPGSHASIYNTRYAGQVSSLGLAEFFRPYSGERTFFPIKLTIPALADCSIRTS